MIPAVLAAQFAKPLVKWGAIIGGITLLVLAIWFHGRATGKEIVQQAWDAAIARQAIDTSEQVIAEAQMSAEVLKSHAQEERQAQAAAEIVEREVIKYVQAPEKPCLVDPDLERLFDAISRMPESSADRMPPADASAGEPVESPETGVTTTEVLQAYYDAVEALMFLWVDYAALVQWERGRFIVQQTQQAQDN